MNQGSNYSAGMSTDFHLPDEILAVIPTDPYDQLDLARKITSMAIASRVSKLESEMGRLKQKISEKDVLIYELQDKVSQLERAFQEADARLREALDENLETFKRHLMQSLNDDSLSQAETVDIGTCDQSVAKSSTSPSLKDDESNGYNANQFKSGLSDATNTFQDTSKYTGSRFSITPYITPRLTPTGTPKVVSTTGSPKVFSAAVSPKRNSGATSPTKSHFDGRPGLPLWYPPSQQSSAPCSPPHGRPLPGRTPRIDGKEFFRQARSRLQYEQFSAFLANIKELNAHRQSREETLRKAEEIFGPDNKDLYLSFQGLLNRSMA
ncbi:Uncharacterized protein EJ110_NYTH47323 [Nymphaea thermarum]|nr:Uncharacterized protein EJ110_NYTH47323 [Nymphaea thermarum]